MPTLSLYIPLSRSRGVLLRLAVAIAQRTSRDRPIRRKLPELPDSLREDVGLPAKLERPPPLYYIPF